MNIKIHQTIDEIPAKSWNQLVENNHPFLKHEFFSALERHNCVGERFGWIAQHISIYENNQLIGALPVYEKHNNYGEFVFDQAWEQAWNQIGLPYYPKLVSASPYTPVMGQRFLIANDIDSAKQQLVFTALYQTYIEQCDAQEMSGCHFLFANELQQHKLQQLEDSNLYARLGFQFHWQNQNYQAFSDFLSQLKPKKRKNIQRERRLVKETGISFRVLNGHQATTEDWENFDYFYQKTFIEKWGTPTLNLDFFKEVGQTLADNIVLVLADLNDECVAGALMFRSDTHLYGRHWGAAKDIKNLHFETCYYQGIDYAIEHKLQTFEPGAGGEHKIARGFTPVEITSYHWLPLNPFGENLDRFIQQEREAVHAYLESPECQSVFKSENI